MLKTFEGMFRKRKPTHLGQGINYGVKLKGYCTTHMKRGIRRPLREFETYIGLNPDVQECRECWIESLV